MVSWMTALPPAAIGALLGAVAVWWMQHPRADLRIAAGSMTVEDYERLLRGNIRSGDFSQHPFPHPDAVLLTNYGNGTAYDIQFKGTHCRPRVWVGDAFKHPLEGQLVEVGPPMWNDTLGALAPGVSDSDGDDQFGRARISVAHRVGAEVGSARSGAQRAGVHVAGFPAYRGGMAG